MGLTMLAAMPARADDVSSEALLGKGLATYNLQCFGGVSANLPPAQHLANCDASLAAVDRAEPVSLSEKAVDQLLGAAFELQCASTMLAIDGMRSTRVCKSTEAAYARFKQIDGSTIDAPFAETVRATTEAASRAAGACRKGFGTPPGAPPIG